MHLSPLVSAAFCTVLIASGFALAQAPVPIPTLVERDGRFALMVDGAPYLMLGAQVNNSSAWPAMLDRVWPTMEALHVNTVEAPIYWEQWEPTQGHFDPSVLDALLAGARAHHVHLVLLWFGTWKNGSGHYTPPFVKLDEARVPHVVGRDGKKVDSLAPYSQVALDADRTAFAALMRRLKATDAQRTVVMVQVENEIGTWGAVRDFSPAAETLFREPVPAAVVAAMKAKPGTWAEAFGKNADEFFYAWSIAKYVNEVAAAGKREYPLPLYINVEARNPIDGGPGSYESGGAVDTVIPIWKVTAPAIDAYGPDMYNGDYAVYTKLLDLYRRPDNATMVPETSNDPAFARFFFATLGHGGIGFSPFGMDTTGYSNSPLGALSIDKDEIGPFASIYSIFGPMQRTIAKLNFEGKVQAVSEDPAGAAQTLDFGDWRAQVSYGMGQFGMGSVRKAGAPVVAEGGAMVAQLGPNEFLVTGVHARVSFACADADRHMQFIRVEEGAYRDGVWKMTRVWNGDQTDYGLNFISQAQVLKVTLATY